MSNIRSDEIQVHTDRPVNDSFNAAERWLATLAHELRDPLSAIILSLDELQKICASEPMAGHTHQIAAESASHMARVIDDTLNLCRSHRRALPVHREPTNVTPIVLGAVHSARLQLQSRGHKLSVSLPTEPLLINAHPVRLQQILTNLLINAAKNTQAGGEISLAIQNSAGTLVISVRDNGVGMTASVVSTLFDSHWKTPSLDAKPSDGLGIGLVLVKSLVQLHNGTVAVSSDGPGRGSEFVVRLPDCVQADSNKSDQHFW
jgi:signal transduction histidine kinase